MNNIHSDILYQPCMNQPTLPMNENFMLSNSKLTSDSQLIWQRLTSHLSSFERDNRAGVYYITATVNVGK